jgi:LruC domain-containing protein
MRLRRALLSLSFALIAGRAGATPVAERAFITETISVPSSVVSFLGTVFPESSAVGTSFLSPTFNPNLLVSETATVKVTFLWEGAGYKNSFGYFTYEESGGSIQIIDRQLVFPNASFADASKGWGGGQLVTGDTVTLPDSSGAPRVFAPGTRIGFFLVSNGWSSTLPWWDASAPTVPTLSPATNASVVSGAYTTIDELNPEVNVGRSDVSRHVAMVRVAGTPGFIGGEDYIVIGMEDLRRSSGADNDFNDVMFMVRSTPEAAIQQTPLPSVNPSSNDPDGDGVGGLSDYFPDDPARAFVTRTPPVGYDSLVFEDLYPSVGDKDYNDVVLQSVIEQVKDAAGGLREIVATYHLVARGARLDHSFGLVIEGVPAQTTGSVQIERFSSGDAQSGEGPAPLAGYLRPDQDGVITLRIDDLVPSTLAALPSQQAYANTLTSIADIPPASVRLRVIFDTPVSVLAVAAPPFDPHLRIKREQGLFDVHLPGRKGLPGRPAVLPAEQGAMSFLDDNGFPWVLQVPSNFRYPLEKVPIEAASAVDCAYPNFATWRSSQGVQKTDWYKTPTLTGNRVSAPLNEGARSRPWTVQAGG